MNLFVFMLSFFSTTLNVGSSAFKNEGYIPAKYTCEGKNINPPLTIADVPKGTKSLVLIMSDPDAPVKVFDHWIVWNIPPSGMIEENSKIGIEGKNDFEVKGYKGPCPPNGTHRYFIMVYALDGMLNLKPSADKKMVEQVMKGHVIASGQLIGLYQKSLQ